MVRIILVEFETNLRSILLHTDLPVDSNILICELDILETHKADQDVHEVFMVDRDRVVIEGSQHLLECDKVSLEYSKEGPGEFTRNIQFFEDGGMDQELFVEVSK